MMQQKINDQWRPLAHFTPTEKPDPGEQVQPIIGKAVGVLALPPQLVDRLVRAVNEALLALTAPDDSRGANTKLITIEILTSRRRASPVATASWGFFLVEKRAAGCLTAADQPRHRLLLYLYQEGIP